MLVMSEMWKEFFCHFRQKPVEGQVEGGQNKWGG